MNKLTTRKLSLLYFKSTNPNVRKAAKEIIDNRRNTAIRIAKQYSNIKMRRNMVKKASGVFRKKLAEIRPILRLYMFSNTPNRNLTKKQQNFKYRSKNPRTNIEKVISQYYSWSKKNRKPMTNKNWAALFLHATPQNFKNFENFFKWPHSKIYKKISTSRR